LHLTLRIGERTIVTINSTGLNPRLYLGVERGWRIGEILKKSRTQPALHVQVSRVIPISTTFCPPPIEPILVTGKRRTGEDQRESFLRIGDLGDNTIDPGVGPRNEGLLHQSDASIIEDPHAVVLVWRNDIDLIHTDLTCRIRIAGYGLLGGPPKGDSAVIELGGYLKRVIDQ